MEGFRLPLRPGYFLVGRPSVMQSVKLADLVEDIEAVEVIGDEAVVHLEYRGSAHVLGRDLRPLRILSRKHEFRVPLVDVSEPDLDLALKLVVGVAASRPVRLSVAQYVDVDIRETLRHIDGRGSWTVSAAFLADPMISKQIPRWMSAASAEIPEGWVVGISTMDSRRPVICVRHGGRVGLLARDPMIAAARV